jgi:hypothetical protein
LASFDLVAAVLAIVPALGTALVSHGAPAWLLPAASPSLSLFPLQKISATIDFACIPRSLIARLRRPMTIVRQSFLFSSVFNIQALLYGY